MGGPGSGRPVAKMPRLSTMEKLRATVASKGGEYFAGPLHFDHETASAILAICDGYGLDSPTAALAMAALSLGSTMSPLSALERMTRRHYIKKLKSTAMARLYTASKTALAQLEEELEAASDYDATKYEETFGSDVDGSS